MWYHPKVIANILGLSNVADNKNYCVQYEPQESKDFIGTRIKDSNETRFCRAPRGLQWLETKSTTNGMDREVPINTVEDNKCSYTSCSYLRAKLTRKLQRIIGLPSIKILMRS